MTQTFIPTPVPEPLPLVESLVDDVLDELDEMGTSLETVNSEALLKSSPTDTNNLLNREYKLSTVDCGKDVDEESKYPSSESYRVVGVPRECESINK